jgi:hypothetical protein
MTDTRYAQEKVLTESLLSPARAMTLVATGRPIVPVMVDERWN